MEYDYIINQKCLFCFPDKNEGNRNKICKVQTAEHRASTKLNFLRVENQRTQQRKQ